MPSVLRTEDPVVPVYEISADNVQPVIDYNTYGRVSNVRSMKSTRLKTDLIRGTSCENQLAGSLQ